MAQAREIDLFLVVPPGLHPAIYPWGVKSLSDYVAHYAVATPRTWALNEEPWLEELATAHAPLLLEVIRSLSKAARGVFVGHLTSPRAFLGVVGALGSELLAVAKRRRLLARPVSRARARRLATGLDEVRRRYTEYLSEGVRACVAISKAEGASRERVWGLSVYDYTLFDILLLCGHIRELDPGARVVLGGDYFDYGSARRVLSATRAVDAVVVGYGEEVLRQYLSAHGQGADVEQLELNGLVTRRSLGERAASASMDSADEVLGLGKASRATREAAVNVPPSYRGKEAVSPIDYVQVEENGTVRVLTQRGCSWGKCTFCSQIDRRMFFSLGPEQLKRQLEAALRSPASGSSRRISLDADENDLNAVLPLLDVVYAAPGNYRVEFWLMVRKFGAELPRYLTGHGSNVKLSVILNIESLSERTLKAMKKGVVALQIIEAVKAIQDTGHVVRTNYFVNYPGEDVESVGEEVALLERVAHLLYSSNMRMSVFSYLANGRDEVHYDRKKFGAVSARVREDVWLEEAFGVDAPFSIWSRNNLRSLEPVTRAALVSYTFHRLAFARRAELSSTASQEAFGGPPQRAPWRERVLDALERAELPLWSALHGAARWLARDDVYRRRDAVFTPPSGESSAPPPSRFSIEGERLVKDYTIPGLEERAQLELSPRELELLRFLYWRRRPRQIEARFPAWQRAELEATLERFARLGALVSDGRTWLSVVHDPGYWRTAESLVEGPKALTDLAPAVVEPPNVVVAAAAERAARKGPRVSLNLVR